MKTVLTVSRRWNNPTIRTVITVEEISLSMDIGDFKTALKKEIGSPLMMFTGKKLSDSIDKAVDNIIAGIKEESSKSVG